ncbi:MAG TPA: hypothetical protein VK013_03425 [Myxococcaceae bacterium]|nr:hypothetical protein [Myxococcaceae bacterium]
MTRLIQALAIVAIGAVAQGCVHHNHGTRQVVVHSDPVVHTSSIDYRYHGYHPIPHAHGGGWCNLDHVHVHHYEPLVSYGYTYYDSYNYWVYSRPRVIYYYGGHYDRHGRFCNHRGRHSHDYLPSRHAASAYTWDSRRNSYVYAPDRRSQAVRGVAPRATPPAGQGVGRVGPPTTPRTRDNVPSVSPGNTGSRNVRSDAPRTSPTVSSPRVSPSPSVDSPRVAPRTSPSAPPSNPAASPRVAPRSSPSAPPPAVREAPRAAPRSSPSVAPSSTPRSTPTPRAEPRTASPRPAPSAVREAPRASPRAAPAASRPAPRAAPARSAPARPQPRR